MPTHVDEFASMSLFSMMSYVLDPGRTTFDFWFLLGMLSWRLLTSKNEKLVAAGVDLYRHGQHWEKEEAKVLLRFLQGQL